MKGTLTKTEQGWVVNYNYSVNKNDWETLPLHPENVNGVLAADVFNPPMEGKEVEFEIVKIWERNIHRNTPTKDDFISYAKLIHHPVDTNEMIDQAFDTKKVVEDDVVKLAEEYAFKVYHAFEDATWFRPLNLGYYAGYKKAKETLYTEEQVKKAYEYGSNASLGISKTNLIQALKK